MAEQTTPAEQPNSLPTADDLQGMTAEALAQHRETALAEAQDLAGIDPAEMTDAQADRIEALADFADALDAEDTRRTEATEARAQRVADAQARLNREAEGEDVEPEAGDEVPAPEAEGADAPEAVEEVQAPEAVAAGGSRRPAPRPAQRRIQKPAEPSGTAGFSLVAAADVGGKFAGGGVLAGMAEAAEAFVQRSKAFPQGVARQKNVYSKHNVAFLERKFQDGLTHTNPDFKSHQDLFQAAIDESRLSGGSLVAAGGWCAPSTTMYGLTSLETLDGIIDLPTVGVDRGGINYTPGPNFGDIYATAGFAQTEAEAIAGTEKNCVEVDCPDFTEVRLDAVGYCVKAPLLTRAAYPEVIQRWLEGTIVANQHKVAARLIAGMRTALGTALAPVLTDTPVTWGTLSIIEWVIEMQRQAYRLAENESLEVVIPRWVKVVIRADLANRNGMLAADRVTDAMINEHFADRGARVQWVLNYLEVATPLTSIAHPATFEVMVYPAGTFVKGTADVINLDTVYDTADLQTNVYTAAFVEDGVLLAKMQHGGARITIPVKASGQTGAANLDDTIFTAQVPNLGTAPA